MHQITFIWQESEKGTLLLINWPGYCQKWYDFSLKILTTRLDAFFPQTSSLVESSSYISVKGHMALFGYGLFLAFSRSNRILLEEVKILTVLSQINIFSLAATKSMSSVLLLSTCTVVPPAYLINFTL